MQGTEYVTLWCLQNQLYTQLEAFIQIEHEKSKCLNYILLRYFNPIQARLFWNSCGQWGGGTLCPPWESHFPLVLTAYFLSFSESLSKA